MLTLEPWTPTNEHNQRAYTKQDNKHDLATAMDGMELDDEHDMDENAHADDLKSEANPTVATEVMSSAASATGNATAMASASAFGGTAHALALASASGSASVPFENMKKRGGKSAN